MKKLEWTNCTVTLGELKPWADNPRFSTKAQAERLIKSFDELGQFQTIAISPTNEVYDGHQRLSALLTVHGTDFQIDARRSSRPLTENERRRIVFAANVQAGNWDADKLASWDAPQVLEWAGVDSNSWQNQKREVAMWGEMLASEREADGLNSFAADEFELADNDIGGESSPFQLKNYANFPSSNALGFPDLLPELLIDCPKDVGVWSGAHSKKHPYYIAVYNNITMKALDKSTALLAFYTHDSKFERIFTNAGEVIEKILAAGFLGVVSPNFSIYSNWPRIVQMFQVYKSRWVSRYMQGVGIGVIPDVDWAGVESLDFCFDGIPFGLPCVSVQMQTKLTEESDFENRRMGIKAIVEKLKPETLLVYGANQYWQQETKDIFKNVTFVDSLALSIRQARANKKEKYNV